MTTKTTTRVQIRINFNRACENRAQAYDRGDSQNVAFWADQAARYERLLNKIA